MKTPTLFSRLVLALAAIPLLALACGCQCSKPPPAPTPAPDYKATSTGPHQGQYKSSGPHQ